MKTLFFVLILSATSAFATSFEQPAEPTASAFTAAGKLYLTVLTDTCNGIHVGLNVEAFCKDDRMTKNYAPVCDAKVSFISTRKGCEPGTRAQVFEMDLNEENVAREAQVLNLTIDGAVISVKVNR